MLLKNQLSTISRTYISYGKIPGAFSCETDIDFYFHNSILIISTVQNRLGSLSRSSNRICFTFKVLKVDFSKFKQRFFLAEVITVNKQEFSTIYHCCDNFFNQYDEAKNWKDHGLPTPNIPIGHSSLQGDLFCHHIQ